MLPTFVTEHKLVKKSLLDSLYDSRKYAAGFADEIPERHYEEGDMHGNSGSNQENDSWEFKLLETWKSSAVPGELMFRLVVGYLSVVRGVFQVFEVVLHLFSIRNCTSLDLLFAFLRPRRGHRNVAHVFTLHRSTTSVLQLAPTNSALIGLVCCVFGLL